MELIVNDKGVTDNFYKIKSFLNEKRVSLRVVTKSIDLTEYLPSFTKEHDLFYDLKEKNITTLRYKNIWFPAGFNANQEYGATEIIDSIDALNSKSRNAQIIFMNLMDDREGVDLQDINKLTIKLKLLGLSQVILASNVGCFKKDFSISEYFYAWKEMVDRFSRNGIHVTTVSLGSSNLIPSIDMINFRSSTKIELRVGEAIFLGTYADINSNLLSLSKDNFSASIQILKRLGGRQYLVAGGYTKFDEDSFLPNQNRILNQTSDHSLFELSKNIHIYNEKIILTLSYSGLARLSENKNIQYVYK